MQLGQLSGNVKADFGSFSLAFPSQNKAASAMTKLPFPEDLSRPALEDRQLRALQRLLSEIDGQNQFWTNRFREQGFEPQKLRSLQDLRQLAPVTKQELVEDQNNNPPYGTNLTYPISAYSRLHQTSGTTGRPMRFLDTPASWRWVKSCWAQMYRIAGLRREDRLCFPFSFGPFIGFWGAFEGATQLDNFCLAAGGMSTDVRLEVILEHEITFICCTPTYALRMIEIAQRKGLDLANSAVRAILVAGEPGGNIPAIRQRIEQGWGARVIDHWGMTDIGCLAVESADHPGGLMMLETEVIAEVVDSDTFKPVPPGTRGELLITNLGRTGMPVIRYRTGDVVCASTEPNPCGRSLLRLEGGILGRADDMVTIRGNNVFPSSVEAVLREFGEVAEYRIVIREKDAMHHMVIEIEPTAELCNGCETEQLPELPGIQKLQQNLARTVRDRLNFSAEIRFVSAESLPRFEMKGRRFVREC
ncbi:phenylacetate--CoA ligase family protein [Rubinisphaera sp. JC750]|uniref:phenylacetate--CoA ligase family protein n=1 Tax=Rubinisphaera sp. JC750 TaxID=2898658 RepID=UPI001F1F46B1|nr:AMP-binding protein [Rubinisphaera sp. JC750]